MSETNTFIFLLKSEPAFVFWLQFMALSSPKFKRNALVVASQQQQRLENIISHQFWQTTQEQIDLYRQLIVTRSESFI